jgi:hypothetical protein
VPGDIVTVHFVCRTPDGEVCKELRQSPVTLAYAD